MIEEVQRSLIILMTDVTVLLAGSGRATGGGQLRSQPISIRAVVDVRSLPDETAHCAAHSICYKARRQWGTVGR